MKNKFIIAIADDDLDDQNLIRQALYDCKVEISIIAVYDGIQLLDYLLKKQKFKFVNETPDLVLLDLNMPLMDGFQALKQIKGHQTLKNVPVYVITTSRSKKERELALDLGATGFYSKGSSSKEIRRIVKEICNECFHDQEAEE